MTGGLADEWPTYRHDNERTGQSSERLELPLVVRWRVQLAPPSPAWPPPAEQDYWNRKFNLRARVTHDRSPGIVVADQKLIVASSATDSVHALDVNNGRLVWSVRTEGPVRLSPSVWKDIVVFGADDGYVYGVDLNSGKQKWRTRPSQIGTRRIPGNDRIISERPIRSGVLVSKDGTGYFSAGVFPSYGAFFFSIDVRSGRILDHATIEDSIQGYLERRDGRVFGPRGRDPNGVYLTHEQATQDSTHSPQPLPAAIYSQISDAQHRYSGLKNRLAASKVDTPDDAQAVWSIEVEGTVYDLAIANKMLFASTDEGWLYALGDATTEALKEDAVQTSSVNADDIALPYRGYVLLVAPKPDDATRLAREFESSRVVVAVDNSNDATAIRHATLQFTNVAVHLHADLKRLNYAEKIFHTIHGGQRDSVVDLLRPYGGTAYCTDGVVVRVHPEQSGSWTHAYGNSGNAASASGQLATEFELQWFGGPGPRKMVDRHLRTMPSLVNDGWMFVAARDRVIVVDAYSGSVTDEVEVPGATRIGAFKDSGWMVADRGKLFLAAEGTCTAYRVSDHGQLGVEHQYKVPWPDRHWGHLSLSGDYLIGTATLPNAPRRSITREAILEGAYSDDRPLVSSEGVFAYKEGTNQLAWQYRASGSIPHPTIAATGNLVYLLENQRPAPDESMGRVLLNDFLKHQPQLVALDVKTGQRKWTQSIDARASAQNAYLIANENHLVLVVSRNDENVWYDSEVYDARTGQRVWSTTQDNLVKVGGNHGEQDKHPLLTGSLLVVEPYVYDLATGQPRAEFNLQQRGYGCGTISASSDALFFRSRNAARFSLLDGSLTKLTTTTRPGCWINMLPAQGMLLIPEASSGCTCNFAVQTSMALVPKRKASPVAPK